MQLRYGLTHANGRVDLRLDDARLVVTTKGVGALDRERTIDVALTDVQSFAVVPAIRAQQAVGRGVRDGSFDGEFLIAYVEGGARKTKRVFVASQDPSFVALVGALAERRPEASLMGVSPDEAYRRIGVLSPKRAVWIVVALAVGIPLLAIAVALLLHC